MEPKEYRARARESLNGNWGQAIGVTLVAGVLGAAVVGGGVSINLDEEIVHLLPDALLILLSSLASISSVLGIAQLVIGGTVQLGYSQYLLKLHDKQPAEFKDLFSQFERFGQGFAQTFLRGLYVFLWSLLFVIPGIVKGYAYAMTPFIMADHPELSANEAITLSKDMMKGYKGELFLLDLSFIGWDLLCLLTLNLGQIALAPYRNAAYAAFYRSFQKTIPPRDTPKAAEEES